MPRPPLILPRESVLGISDMLQMGWNQKQIAEYFMGHTLDATRTAYFRASPDKLRDLYIQYVPALTIQEAVDLESPEEYQRMKDENQAYAATKGKDSLKVDMALSEVERLEREIHALKAWVEVRDIIAQAKLRKNK